MNLDFEDEKTGVKKKDDRFLKIGYLYKFESDQHNISVWGGNNDNTDTRYGMGNKDDIFLVVSGSIFPYSSYITIMFNGIVGEARLDSLLASNIVCISDQEQ